MSMEDYRKALKQGQKTFRACVARGQHPYPQVLDDILENANIERAEPLGVVDVPMELIVGTKTAGRKRAFARDFMPLLPEKSEFAVKWVTLCRAQVQEGIRDPIVAYEFLNRFYVQEGNKRVSVLKYFGAASIPATVTRLVPRPTDTLENRMYYEFMGFYAAAGINYLEFSRPGSYARLLAALGKKPGQKWTVEERQYFASLYIPFRRVFQALGGEKLDLTAGDALLAFLNVYPYREALAMSGDQLRDRLERMWPEVAVLAEPDGIELSLSAPAVQPQPLLARLLPAGRGPLRCAFLYERTPTESAWTYGHEFGRSQVQQTLAGRVETKAYFDVKVGENDDAMLEQAIAEGCSVVFTTTPKLMGAALRAAVAHPTVQVFNCSLNMKHPQVRTYYGRIYEAKFILGAIAGALCDDGKVGYLASYPIYGMTAGVNAFALGVQMTNPRARVYLEWTSSQGPDAKERFAGEGVRLVCGQDARAPGEARPAGLYRYQDEQHVQLAAPFWHWGAFYEMILQRLLAGGLKDAEPERGPHAFNYWWGMSSGVIDVLLSRKLPLGPRQLARLLRSDICCGVYDPFTGPLLAQGGRAVLPREGARLTPEQILRMDWLCDNVVGHIPAFEELIDAAKPLVRLQGVLPGEGQA